MTLGVSQATSTENSPGVDTRVARTHNKSPVNRSNAPTPLGASSCRSNTPPLSITFQQHKMVPIQRPDIALIKNI